MRRVSRSAAIVVAGRLVIGLVAILLLLLRSTLWYALPTVDTVTTVTAAVPAFVRSVTEQAAPVAAIAPVILVLAVVFVLLAVSVDALAVTKRMPRAPPGTKLLTAYVAAASNSTEGLAFTYFLIPAAAWVALLAHEGTARLVRWGAVIARPRGGQARNPAPGILTWARGVALIAIAAAVVLPGVLPHLPPRFIADGLARGDRGGNGVGSCTASTLAVAQASRRPFDPAGPSL